MKPANWTWLDELATVGAVLACELLILAAVAGALWALAEAAQKALAGGG